MSPVDRLRAPAKLTRALRVVGVRDDGHHLLEAEMATVDLADELEVEEATEGLEIVDEVAWVVGTDPGPPAGPVEVPLGPENIVLRALVACGRRARVRLLKRIPTGAGLGGGSADAAAVLRWAGALDPALAASLGADVPFCVVGGRALVSGIGEVVEPLGFEAFTAVLVTPSLSVSTSRVYRAWDALGCPNGQNGNDLEPAALVVEPRLAWWRDLVSGIAGEPPRLAGSGGTWFLERDAKAAGHLVAQIRDAVRAEQACGLVTAVASTPRL